MYEYTVKTDAYEVHVTSNGMVCLEDPRDGHIVDIPATEWQHVIEDVRAITHLRKRAGDWDE